VKSIGTRIENPNIKGACFIAENILKHFANDAAKRCGLYDTLYDAFFKENVYAFADTLEFNERDKFLTVAHETYPSFDKSTQTLKEAMKEIEEE
jgi:hypothetical protein